MLMFCLSSTYPWLPLPQSSAFLPFFSSTSVLLLLSAPLPYLLPLPSLRFLTSCPSPSFQAPTSLIHSLPAVGLEAPCCHITQPPSHQTFLNHGMLFPGPSLKCPFPCLPQLPSLCLIFYLPVGSIPVFFINSLFCAHIHPQPSYSSNFSIEEVKLPSF